MDQHQGVTSDLTPAERYVCGMLDGLTVALVIAIVLVIAL